MKPKISIKHIWSDEDVIELTVEVCNGKSIFSNEVYIGNDLLGHLIDDLSHFRKHIQGGLYDIKLGEFGPEYSNGAFQARLHFQAPGTLNISTSQQSDFDEFSNNRVASEARMYLTSEPVMLDNFINELRAINSGVRTEATLKCI